MRAQRWRTVTSVLPLACTILAVGIIATTRTALDAAERHPAFSLGILRRDGILIPFAVYDGKHWKNPWPAPEETSTMPIGITDIPKGWWNDKHPVMDWRLFLLERSLLERGQSPDSTTSTTSSQGAAHVKGINWFFGSCQRVVGLRTDYKPAIMPPPFQRMHPFPKDALAFAGDVTISPIEIVGPTDPVAASLAKKLPDAITPREDRAIERYAARGYWTHSYNARERQQVHVDPEALYRVRHSLDGHDLYYFEGIKRYFLPKNSARDSAGARAPAKSTTPGRQPTCDLVTFASGWFMTDATGAIAGDLAPRVIVTSCDYQHVGIMLPLGTVTLEGKTLWIVQWSNPTFESYAILQPTESLVRPIDKERASDAETLLESSGGNCMRDED